MSTAIRELVQNNLEEAILGVSTSNGFDHTVLHYERARVVPYDGPFPAIFGYDGGDTLSEEYSYANEWTMTMEFECWLKTTQSPTELSTEVNAFIADFIKAVMADRERGGYAIETKVTAVGPPAITDDNMGGCVIVAEVLYRTQPDDPYTQA